MIGSIVIGVLLSLVGIDESAPLMQWAGHQVSYGHRSVPFRGKVKTRSDVRTLARVVLTSSGLELQQQACMVSFAPVAGVSVSLDAKELPPSQLAFDRDGAKFNGKSKVAWGSEDIDGDGNPGMTISVESMVCSGDVYVASSSKTRATAKMGDGGRLKGFATVGVRQKVLGVSSSCLSLGPDETNESMSGPFAYTPVSARATCSDLLSKQWPVDAEL